MIADPMAFFTRAAYQNGAFGRDRLLPHGEEGRFDIVPGQAIENGRSDLRLRPVIKSESEFPPSGGADALVRAGPLVRLP
jgi:hypothetical protein